MSSTNADPDTSSKIDAASLLATDARYSFFWEENSPDSYCTSEIRMELQTTVALPIKSVESLSLTENSTQTTQTHQTDEPTEGGASTQSYLSNHESETNSNLGETQEVDEEQSHLVQYDAIPGSSEVAEYDTSMPYYTENIYRPTVISAGASAQDIVMQRRMLRRQIRRAEEFLRNSVLQAGNNHQACDEFAIPTRQSTQYCDIDANDDATLWMLLQLSAKKLRGQVWPCRNRDDLRELVLIRKVAEKAFNHLFPHIKA